VQKGCKAFNCGCKKKEWYCGPGCLCQGCTNVEHNNVPTDQSNISSSDDSDCGTSSSEDSEEGEDLEEEIITDDDFYFSSYDITIYQLNLAIN